MNWTIQTTYTSSTSATGGISANKLSSIDIFINIYTFEHQYYLSHQFYKKTIQSILYWYWTGRFFNSLWWSPIWSQATKSLRQSEFVTMMSRDMIDKSTARWTNIRTTGLQIHESTFTIRATLLKSFYWHLGIKSYQINTTFINWWSRFVPFCDLIWCLMERALNIWRQFSIVPGDNMVIYFFDRSCFMFAKLLA